MDPLAQRRLNALSTALTVSSAMGVRPVLEELGLDPLHANYAAIVSAMFAHTLVHGGLDILFRVSRPFHRLVAGTDLIDGPWLELTYAQREIRSVNLLAVDQSSSMPVHGTAWNPISGLPLYSFSAPLKTVEVAGPIFHYEYQNCSHFMDVPPRGRCLTHFMPVNQKMGNYFGEFEDEGGKPVAIEGFRCSPWLAAQLLDPRQRDRALVAITHRYRVPRRRRGDQPGQLRLDWGE